MLLGLDLLNEVFIFPSPVNFLDEFVALIERHSPCHTDFKGIILKESGITDLQSTKKVTIRISAESESLYSARRLLPSWIPARSPFYQFVQVVVTLFVNFVTYTHYLP